MSPEHRRRRQSHHEDSGTAGLFGLLIGGGLFTIGFATIILVSTDRYAEAPNESEEGRGRADANVLVDLVYGSSGQGWYSSACPTLPSAGTFTPEDLRRFGLAREPCEGPTPGSLHLSYSKLENLRSAKVLADPSNLHVDYAEAKESLQIGPGQDFHLRIRAQLPTLESVLESGRRDVNIRPLYVGDYRKLGLVWLPEPAVVPEITFIQKMVTNFQPNAYSLTYSSATVPYLPGGDVVPDDKTAVQAFLPSVLTPGGTASLSTYNLVVVGSNLESNEMNSPQALAALSAWVDAGGLLLVLGSDDTTYTWLEPDFKAKQEAATGSPAVPLPDHTLVTIPDRLDVSSYLDHGRAWNYNAAGVGSYEDVSTHGGATASVSKEGAFGKGEVFFTSFRPYDIDGLGSTGACSLLAITADCQGLLFLHNAFAQFYDGLNLEFGPALPTTGSVSSAHRLAIVDDPEAGSMTLDVWVYAW